MNLANSRIVNAKPSTKEYPWMVYITRTWKQKDTGVDFDERCPRCRRSCADIRSQLGRLLIFEGLGHHHHHLLHHSVLLLP